MQACCAPWLKGYQNKPGPGAIIDSFAFDTSDYPEEDRVDRYQKAYSPGASVCAAGPAFRASFTAFRLDDSLIYERKMNDVAHDRSAERIEKDGYDHFVVTAVLAGSFEVATGGPYRTVPVDAISLLSLSHPMKSRSRDAHLLTLSLARNRLTEKAVALIGVDGLVLEGVMAEFLRSHLMLVARSAPDFDPMQARDVASATFSMLDATIGHTQPLTYNQSNTADDNARFIKDFVEANLSDPDLGIAQIVRQTGLSRATIYRQFNSFGGVSSYVRSRRLRRLAIELIGSDKSLEGLSAENGFTSAGQASRAFQQLYGIRPGEYRRRLQANWLDGVPEGLMDVFLTEVLPAHGGKGDVPSQ